MVEPRIVVPDVAGSNPVGHPSAIQALPEGQETQIRLAQVQHRFAPTKNLALMLA